jgi:hypothetical protein
MAAEASKISRQKLADAALRNMMQYATQTSTPCTHVDPQQRLEPAIRLHLHHPMATECILYLSIYCRDHDRVPFHERLH